MGETRSARAQSIRALRALLNSDLFASMGSDAELDALVERAARRLDHPYAWLLHRLVGCSPEWPEDQARTLWADGVAHRRHLEASIGRPVHLRVAVMDLMTTRQPGGMPLVVAPALVASLVDAVAPDTLTGMQSRQEFAAVVAHELRQRIGRRPVLAWLDVDGMARIRTAQGVRRADECLKQFSDAIRIECREGDTFARIGTDQFAGLFTGCDVLQARAVLERIARRFVETAGPQPVTVLAGFAQAVPGEDVRSLSRRAQGALRRARIQRIGTTTAANVPDPIPLIDRPRVVYATTQMASFLTFHEHVSGWGAVLLPALDVDTLRSLTALVDASWVLADAIFPPKGGEEALKRGAGGRESTLIVPAGWQAGTQALDVEIMVMPETATSGMRACTRKLGARNAPLPLLASEDDARALAEAVRALMVGGAVDAGLAARPEMELLSTLLRGAANPPAAAA